MALSTSVGDESSSVYLNGTLYVGGRSNAGFDLYSFKPGVDSTWTVTDTPTNRYTLVAHDSELLLVGGKEYPTHEITNKVFTMRDGQFVETLPPMKERRRSPSAVMSSGSALVVAGGWNTSGDLSSVEVFKDVQWTTAPSLPSAGYNTKSALHGDQWYLITGQGKVFCASLQSLISGDDKSPWETLPDAPNRFQPLPSLVAISCLLEGVSLPPTQQPSMPSQHSPSPGNMLRTWLYYHCSGQQLLSYRANN